MKVLQHLIAKSSTKRQKKEKKHAFSRLIIEHREQRDKTVCIEVHNENWRLKLLVV
jgi:hypothetical protein